MIRDNARKTEFLPIDLKDDIFPFRKDLGLDRTLPDARVSRVDWPDGDVLPSVHIFPLSFAQARPIYS